MIQRAERNGCKGLFVTVDAPQLGRRERDMRFKAPQVANEQKQRGEVVDMAHGTSAALSSFIDASLCWNDLDWIRSVTKMPVCLKGIQSGADAITAARVRDVARVRVRLADD